MTVITRPERRPGPGMVPARYFAEHPLAYGLALAGSGGAAVYAFGVAARPGRPRRVLWLALGAQCAAQFAGIVVATEVMRRRDRLPRSEFAEQASQ